VTLRFPRRGHVVAALLLCGSIAVLGCSRKAETGRGAAAPDSAGTFHGAKGEPSVTVLARRLVEAHGGIGPWMAVRTIRYTVKQVAPGQEKPWVATETVEESPARRLYQDWTDHGGTLTWDGHEVWTVHWGLPNPPRLMPFLDYYSLVTPWLPFSRGVTVVGSGKMKIPGGDGTSYPSFTVRFPPDPERPPVCGYYRILVDPKTGVMKALSYTITYRPYLDELGIPRDRAELGPFTHVYDEYTRVDGLLLPSRYHTVGPDGKPAGEHWVTGYKVNAPFDESRMKKPAGAVVDAAPDAGKSPA
jgi:hypothetical protein